ncbi:hypothetical protein DLAC_00580 [Tieghemostelium lacteum]|uniref:Uncharacterized protein n=1 Tax=Tieghemostelium lacteum TaxID=361077 RepID=A0A152AA41_TIELA|nr:hypothetical protein DLAC_00580 [Tieghemostelium lacteum]|eukprot:KYR03088.1 hypothetical protein DLAC_00580 [Tieghemostelium lacteum]
MTGKDLKRKEPEAAHTRIDWNQPEVVTDLVSLDIEDLKNVYPGVSEQTIKKHKKEAEKKYNRDELSHDNLIENDNTECNNSNNMKLLFNIFKGEDVYYLSKRAISFSKLDYRYTNAEKTEVEFNYQLTPSHKEISHIVEFINDHFKELNKEYDFSVDLNSMTIINTIPDLKITVPFDYPVDTEKITHLENKGWTFIVVPKLALRKQKSHEV